MQLEEIKRRISLLPLDAPNLLLSQVLRVVKRVDHSESEIDIHLTLGYPIGTNRLAALRTRIETALDHLFTVRIHLTIKIEPHIASPQNAAIPEIKNIIGIASGKGGVGKSTTAVNIALALAQEGAQVGLLDADVYGPNQPHLLGAHEKPTLLAEKRFMPVIRYGIQSMSMGYLVDDHTPMVWRGPLISSALNQLLRSTQWSQLDYLIVDLPPGTGDIQLTLAKQTPLSAVVVVTTPQDVALLDVRKAVAMFDKMGVPVLGVIENMATHVCTQCGHAEAIFGAGGGEKLAAESHIAFLGRLPLSRFICETSDTGRPIIVSDPEGDLAQCYTEMAIRTAAILSTHKKSYAHVLGPVEIENKK